MLSDVCSDFMQAFSVLAKSLANDAYRYSSPDAAFQYGDEIDALRRACLKVADDPHNVTAGAELLRLAEAIRRYHDTPPNVPEGAVREAEMLALVKILREGAADETIITREFIERLTREGTSGEEAAQATKTILERLGKPAYDAAIKIVSDIGSASVRHLLGL